MELTKKSVQFNFPFRMQLIGMYLLYNKFKKLN
jgi:hypothetical protein